MKKALLSIIIVTIVGSGYYAWSQWNKNSRENKILKRVIDRLDAESRIAEVLVTDVNYDSDTAQHLTTIKFLEYDSLGNPLKPQYFTFSGNIIQFQSFVVRFDDMYVKEGHPVKGKSMHLFWKVFMLDGENTQEYPITKLSEIPRAYKILEVQDPLEHEIWRHFWEYALNPSQAKKVGIKNVQIEAPGTLFIPGTIYTVRIEHDGGMRIDAMSIPHILRGEYIP